MENPEPPEQVEESNSFVGHLARAQAIVATWSQWKKEALGDCSSQYRSAHIPLEEQIMENPEPASDKSKELLTLIIQRADQQDKEIASLKTQVQELQSSLQAIELRLDPIEMERRRYC